MTDEAASPGRAEYLPQRLRSSSAREASCG